MLNKFVNQSMTRDCRVIKEGALNDCPNSPSNGDGRMVRENYLMSVQLVLTTRSQEGSRLCCIFPVVNGFC